MLLASLCAVELSSQVDLQSDPAARSSPTPLSWKSVVGSPAVAPHGAPLGTVVDAVLSLADGRPLEAVIHVAPMDDSELRAVTVPFELLMPADDDPESRTKAVRVDITSDDLEARPTHEVDERYLGQPEGPGTETGPSLVLATTLLGRDLTAEDGRWGRVEDLVHLPRRGNRTYLVVGNELAVRVFPWQALEARRAVDPLGSVSLSVARSIRELAEAPVLEGPGLSDLANEDYLDRVDLFFGLAPGSMDD